MRSKTLACALAIASLAIPAAPAFADPSFGPGAGEGNGNNRPHDQGAKCHPPGQTNDRPECK